MIKKFTLGASALFLAGYAFADPIVLSSSNPAYSSSIEDTGNGYERLIQDITLSPNGTDGYILEGNLLIPAGRTMTIQPGVIVRGQPEIEEDVDVPGALIAARDGTLIAEGTANSPIIFTTAATVDANGARHRWFNGTTEAFLDPTPDTAPLAPVSIVGGSPVANVNLWGAVTLLGNAPTNLGTNAVYAGASDWHAGRGVIEGFGIYTDDFVYGGEQPNDSSGSLRYVSIRHTGSTFGDADEQQGLTLGAVGYGTTLEYIDIYCSSDDGIEIFGGTVAIKHFMISYCDDDALDMDQGYCGFIQFGFLLGNGLTGQNYTGDLGPATMGEWDGDDVGEHSDNFGYADYTVSGAPFANPTMYNLTIFGGNANKFSDDEMLHMRNNFGGNLYNSYVAFGETGVNDADSFRLISIAPFDNYNVNKATPGSGNEIVNPAITDLYPNPSSTEQAQAGTLNIAGVIFWKIGNDVAADNTFNVVTLEMVTNNDAASDPEVFCPGAFGNAFGTVDPQFGGFAGVSATSANNQEQANGLNPVPFVQTDAAVGYTGTFFDEVGYTGAFPSDLFAPLFTNGWTAMNKRGILVSAGFSL